MMSAYYLAPAKKLWSFGHKNNKDCSDQKQPLVDIAQKLVNEVNNDPELLETVITRDKTWVYGYDVKTKVTWRASIEKIRKV